MENSTITCTNCGATCKAKDEYCKHCWKKLGDEIDPGASNIAGMSQDEWTEWEEFIDKNADHYIGAYQKHPKKKFFAHMNWSAFFFGLSWVLYRKMFKVALIAFVATYFISALLMVMCMLPYRAELIRLNEDIEAYQSYLKSDRETVLIDEKGESYTPDVLLRGVEATRKRDKIETFATFMSYLTLPLTCIFWGLFGDCIYKMHIQENIRTKNGGTSIGEFFGGRILLAVVELLLLGPLDTLIMKILFIR